MAFRIVLVVMLVLALAAPALAQPAEAPIEPERRGTAPARRGADPDPPVPVRPVPGRPAVRDPWYRHSAPDRVLRDGSATEAGLVADHLAAVVPAADAGLAPSPETPHYAGYVALAAKDGVVALHEAGGEALRYEDNATVLPADERIPMAPDTIFDLASVSKLFTSLAVMQLVEQDRLDLDAPVADVLPAFAAGGKAALTPRHLLTHTSGLPSWIPLYTVDGDRADRIAVALEEPLDDPAGTVYRYSDLNLIALGEMVTAIDGRPLDTYVAEEITAPLGMADTGYAPDPALRDRIAATEYQPAIGRGMVHGSVHDENAWSLDGVAGHAGVFSTARDLAVMAQTLLNGGVYGGARVLEAPTVAQMMANENTAFPGDDHGLGFELSQRWYMDAMTTPWTAGHTGYTGTSLVIDPTTDSFAILLTNRVHPSREWGSNNPERRAVARAVARAVPVAPLSGPDAWFSGLADSTRRTLELDLDVRRPRAALRAGVWYDTEPEADTLTVEVSDDGGTTWAPLPGELRTPRREPFDGVLSGWSGRRWYAAGFGLGDRTGPVRVRFTYATDALYSGRGVYIDDLSLLDGGRPRPIPDAAITTDGWTLARD